MGFLSAILNPTGSPAYPGEPVHIYKLWKSHPAGGTGLDGPEPGAGGGLAWAGPLACFHCATSAVIAAIKPAAAVITPAIAPLFTVPPLPRLQVVEPDPDQRRIVLLNAGQA